MPVDAWFQVPLRNFKSWLQQHHIVLPATSVVLDRVVQILREQMCREPLDRLNRLHQSYGTFILSSKSPGGLTHVIGVYCLAPNSTMLPPQSFSLRGTSLHIHLHGLKTFQVGNRLSAQMSRLHSGEVSMEQSMSQVIRYGSIP